MTFAICILYTSPCVLSVMDSISLVLLRLRSVLHFFVYKPCIRACRQIFGLILHLSPLSGKATPRITLGVVGRIYDGPGGYWHERGDC